MKTNVSAAEKNNMMTMMHQNNGIYMFSLVWMRIMSCLKI